MNLKALRNRDVELRAELARVTRERAAIGEKTVAEKRSMTDDERKDFLAFGPKIDGIQAQLNDNALLLAAAEEANEAERAMTSPAATSTLNADDAAAAAAAKAAGHTPRITVAAPAIFGVFGRQLQAIRRAAISAKGGDEPMTSEDRQLLKSMSAAATGMTTDVPSDGGFLVGQERSTTILQRSYATGQILSRVGRMPIGPNSNGMKIPAIDETSRADNSRYGGIVSGWLGQGNGLTSGKPKFRELDMKLRKVGAFVYATDEQVADAIALEAWINKYLPLELAFRTEDAIVNGDGSNKPQGFLTSPAVISVTRNTSGKILYEDVSGMWMRMWAPLRLNSVWLIDQSCESALEQLSIAIGTAGVLAPIYKPAGSVPGQEYATLYGRPVIPVEYMAAYGTSGDIALVNLDEYVMIDKGGIEQATSLHVAFLTDEAVFRFIYRCDGQLSWNAAMTPKSGGSTLSCAVILTT